MKIKISDLNGLALHYAVALCEGGKEFAFDGITWGFRLNRELMVLAKGWARSMSYCPGDDWGIAGPIIEREGILLRAIRSPTHTMDGCWLAMRDGTNTGSMVHWVKREDFNRHYFAGPTPLVAAMRCYVASKLGEEMELPDALLTA